METKPWYLSLGVWAGVATLALGVLAAFGIIGVEVAQAEAQPIADNVVGLITSVLGLLEIIGRIRATKKITV